jgi:2-phospho-L-lactate guanylyltransferase
VERPRCRYPLPMAGRPDSLKTAAVIPVKRLDSSLGRLTGFISDADRRRLAEALYRDLLAKIRRSRTIDSVILVTSDPVVIQHARWVGHEVVTQGADSGHSSAARTGALAALVRGHERVVMLPTDCPLFDPAELDARIGRTPRTALIVPDRHGTGTNALVLCPPDAFAPAFGDDSCARHISRARATGIGFALERVESLETDLDTPEDFHLLRDALIMNPQPAFRTAQVLWELGAQPEPTAA